MCVRVCVIEGTSFPTECSMSTPPLGCNASPSQSKEAARLSVGCHRFGKLPQGLPAGAAIQASSPNFSLAFEGSSLGGFLSRSAGL